MLRTGSQERGSFPLSPGPEGFRSTWPYGQMTVRGQRARKEWLMNVAFDRRRRPAW